MPKPGDEPAEGKDGPHLSTRSKEIQMLGSLLSHPFPFSPGSLSLLCPQCYEKEACGKYAFWKIQPPRKSAFFSSQNTESLICTYHYDISNTMSTGCLISLGALLLANKCLLQE